MINVENLPVACCGLVKHKSTVECDDVDLEGAAEYLRSGLLRSVRLRGGEVIFHSERWMDVTWESRSGDYKMESREYIA